MQAYVIDSFVFIIIYFQNIDKIGTVNCPVMVVHVSIIFRHFCFKSHHVFCCFLSGVCARAHVGFGH